VTPLTVNSQINRIDQSSPTLVLRLPPIKFRSQVNTFTPVGILIMIVAVEK